MIDSSVRQDVISVISKEGCLHYQYYVCRLQVLQNTLTEVLEQGKLSNVLLHAIAEKVKEIKSVGRVKGTVVWAKEFELIPLLKETTKLINGILPKTKSILVEWTDVGPVSQKAVKFRAAKIPSIFDLD